MQSSSQWEMEYYAQQESIRAEDMNLGSGVHAGYEVEFNPSPPDIVLLLNLKSPEVYRVLENRPAGSCESEELWLPKLALSPQSVWEVNSSAAEEAPRPADILKS